MPSRRAYDLDRADDLRFLRAWEQGLLPVVGAAVRVRQIRRALAALPPAALPLAALPPAALPWAGMPEL